MREGLAAEEPPPLFYSDWQGPCDPQYSQIGDTRSDPSARGACDRVSLPPVKSHAPPPSSNFFNVSLTRRLGRHLRRGPVLRATRSPGSDTCKAAGGAGGHDPAAEIRISDLSEIVWHGKSWFGLDPTQRQKTQKTCHEALGYPIVIVVFKFDRG